MISEYGCKNTRLGYKGIYIDLIYRIKAYNFQIWLLTLSLQVSKNYDDNTEHIISIFYMWWNYYSYLLHITVIYQM